ESDEIDSYLVAPKAEVLAALVGSASPAAVLVASTPEGKEIAARVAIRTGSGILTDAVGLDAGGVATQNIFGGAVIVRSRVRRGTPIITVRPNSVTPEPAPAQPTEQVVPVELSDAARGAKVLDRVVE